MQEKQASRIFLIAAIIIGILATGMAFIYLQNSAGQDKGPKYKMLQARHDLQPGNPIDPDKDFDEVEIPEGFKALRERALDPNAKSSYKGQRVNHLVLAGSYVLQSDLTAIGGIKLDADKRALSVSVKGNNGILPDLYVGDLVKLYITERSIRSHAADTQGAPISDAPADTPSSIVVRTGELPFNVFAILPTPVRVLSIGGNASRTRRPVTAIEQYDSLSQSNNLQTVTVEVTEEQARIILANTGSGAQQVAVVLLLCPPHASTATPETAPATKP